MYGAPIFQPPPTVRGGGTPYAFLETCIVCVEIPMRNFYREMFVVLNNLHLLLKYFYYGDGILLYSTNRVEDIFSSVIYTSLLLEVYIYPLYFFKLTTLFS